MRHLLLAILLLASPALADASPAIGFIQQEALVAAQIKPFDQWYINAADGKKTGWSRRHLTQDEKGNWVLFESNTSVEIQGGSQVKQVSHKKTVETKDGKPVLVINTSTQSNDKNEQTMVQTWCFGEEGIEFTSQQGTTQMKRLLPKVLGTWYLSTQATALHRAHHLAGDKNFEIPMFDPSLGNAPYSAIYARLGEENLILPIGAVQATKYKMTYSNLPGVVSYEWYDAGGLLVNNTCSMSGIALTNQWALPENAQASFVPSETTAISVVQVDKPIENPALLHKAVYELNYSPDCPLVPPSLCEQTVEKLANGKIKVTVNLDATEKSYVDGVPPQKEDLAESIMIDFKDPSVQALLPQIFNRFADVEISQGLRARETTRFVSRYMAEGADLSVDNGTASQTAKTRQGDCTEHAALLTALLRAQGIPARVATGMAYAGDEGFVESKHVFVYHMWTQAWLKEDNGKSHWVNLDAALRRFDAVHILLGVSSLDDVTSADDELKITPMMESMSVKVIELSK